MDWPSPNLRVVYFREGTQRLILTRTKCGFEPFASLIVYHIVKAPTGGRRV